MKRFFLPLFLFLFPLLTAAAGPLNPEDARLVGTDTGLWRQEGSGLTRVGGLRDVRKILRAGDRWFFLAASGIWSSADLVAFEERDAGLPVKTLKIPGDAQEGTAKRFEREIQELKDLAAHPQDPNTLVTANKDGVWLTRDGGRTWRSLGSSAVTSGVKAVAVLSLPDKAGTEALTVFMSHPIYGVSWKQPDAPNAAWTDLNGGLEKVPSIKWPDEVSSFSITYDSGRPRLFAAQTFMPRIYELDWAAKGFVPRWKGNRPADSVEGLQAHASGFVFTGPSALQEAVPGGKDSSALGAGASTLAALSASASFGSPQCLYLGSRHTGGRGDLSLSELWLLGANSEKDSHNQKANGKKGMYVPVWQATTAEGLAGHLKTMKANGLDTMVIDMKDDYGTLRYDARDPVVLEKGAMGKGVTLESFVKTCKENGIYLVARIVVFKDKALARYGGGRYAVWDKAEKKSWQGYELVTPKIEVGANAAEAAKAAESATAPGAPAESKPEKVRKYYEEYWVDPYSEDVWDYNVRIARELVARGFDEIQFDYIRFPTDGTNLGNASFRWQDPGMDKESALMSFLAYARSHIDAPISIDIYGANGWYRTGARTGQDVELLSRYVNVICPMFYPSHFEQAFLAQEPAVDRPWRIFYYGTWRNAVIARNKAVIRPWVQAFYLNVSYDRAWYNEDYVQRQVFGARDSIDEGYLYWNNSGRYSDLRPDMPRGAPYPWQAPAESLAGKLDPLVR